MGTEQEKAEEVQNQQQYDINELTLQNKRAEQALITNAHTFQRKLTQMFTDDRRNIEKECGYPQTDELDITRYKELYEREPIAAKVVDLLPEECWRVHPEVFETEDADSETEFEEAWEELGKDIQGPGFFKTQDDQGHPVWEVLERADKLSGIGSYGCILLGIDDSKALDEPADFSLEGSGATTRKLLFMKTLDEENAEIHSYEEDETSRRYKQPLFYNITFDQSGSNQPHTKIVQTRTIKVHWTRVIHIADKIESSAVFGAPRMRVVYNRLYDLYKLYGGSAEMYWLGAFMGLAFETHPELGGDVEIDQEAMRAGVESYIQGLQRFVALPGMSAKTLAPQVVDPTAQIEVQLTALCVSLRCPKRIFMGSERGELASGQDSKAWNGTVKHRQNAYVTPSLIVKFVDRLIQLSILPMPAEGYGVKWPDLTALSELERADIAVKRTEALVKYLQGNVEGIMDPLDFLIRILAFTTEEAQEIIDARTTTEIETQEPDMSLFGEFTQEAPFPNDKGKSNGQQGAKETPQRKEKGFPLSKSIGSKL